MKKVAEAYERGGKVYIHPESRTKNAFWILQEPVLLLGSESPNDALGAALQEALAASRCDVTDPPTFKGVADPLLTAAGVKSWKAFAKGAISVRIEQEGETVTLTPRRQHPVKKSAFESEPQKAVRTTYRDAQELGTALRGALKACALSS